MRIALFMFIISIAVAGVQVIFAAVQTVAVLPSEGVLNDEELEYLTDKAQEIAVRVLPNSNFEVFPQDVIIKRLGGADSYVKECKESSCIVDLGKKAMVDYVAQCRFGKLGSDFRIAFELYKVSTSGLIDKFSESAKDIDGLLAIMQEKIPDGFMKIPGAALKGKVVLPPVVGGIRDLERTVDYEFDDEKRYLASVSTEPQGAALSFNGVPDDRCNKTPCKTEFPEGSVRIIARLEQYETADTTISIKQNNQNIAIALKPSFGVLEIVPTYSDGIGAYRQWNLSINDKSYSLGEIRLSPGNYAVKLNHECYENIGFTAGIHKGKREVFDMSRHVTLKKGGLVLRAERNGEPASEPVFVNGRQVGETPFSGSIPLCAVIEIGQSREKVNVELKHNDKVEHIVHETREQRMEREQQEQLERKLLEQELRQQESQKLREMLQQKAGDAYRTSWHGEPLLGLGGAFFKGSIDFPYSGGGLVSFGGEFFYGGVDFIRFGLNMDLGWFFIDDDMLKRIHPDVISDSTSMAILFKTSAFARLYPVNVWYLSGSAGMGYHGDYYSETKNGDKISESGIWEPVFSIGTGLASSFGISIDAQYNILPHKSDAWYVTVNIVFKVRTMKQQLP
ncbi:MAG: PEGA domain-containing protein [Candidatus Fibromonas sp.]|nr:PEGA domain-containing protein [Candidatus Fibromonas sp.]